MSKDIVNSFVQYFYDLETQLTALFSYIQSEDAIPEDFGTQWALIQNTSFKLVNLLGELYYTSFKAEISSVDKDGNSIKLSCSSIVAELIHKLFLFCILKAAAKKINQDMVSDLLGLMYIDQSIEETEEVTKNLRDRILELLDLLRTVIDVYSLKEREIELCQEEMEQGLQEEDQKQEEE